MSPRLGQRAGRPPGRVLQRETPAPAATPAPRGTGEAATLPRPCSSSGAGGLYPRYDLPFGFSRVKAFSGIIETCSQHVREAGAPSRNKPRNIGQRRFYPVGPGGLFNTTLVFN